MVDAVGEVCHGRRGAGDADLRAPSRIPIRLALIAQFELGRAADHAVLHADIRQRILVAFVAKLPTEVTLRVRLSRKTLFETSEWILIGGALIAEYFDRGIPRDAELVAQRRICAVRTQVAELRSLTRHDSRKADHQQEK